MTRCGKRRPPKFLRRFRNYLLHYGQAPFVTSGNWASGDDAMKVRIFLDRSALMEWDGWTARARAFIEDHDGDIQLITVVAEYHDRMEEVYTWLMKQFEVLHRVDIDAVNRLVSQRNLALTGDMFASAEDFNRKVRDIDLSKVEWEGVSQRDGR